MSETVRQAAQNQHYVPKFILRQFLSNGPKERVSAYDKHSDKTFVTSISNMMAERRFNEFAFADDLIASFEPMACAIEDMVLPSYRKVLEGRRLDHSPEEKAALSLLIAFQFLRTKAHRGRLQEIESQLVNIVEASGGKMQDVKGWEEWKPQTEESIKHDHLAMMKGHLDDIIQLIAAKDFVLSQPSEGRSFYLGDNPVCLSNDNDFGPYGNLGFGVRGIQIYMPLASDLMLCAWCPSILAELKLVHADGKQRRRAEAIGRFTRREISTEQMKSLIMSYAQIERSIEELLKCVAQGLPITSTQANMDYYNSLQTSYAYRHVICQKEDFTLARKFNAENPALRRGRRLSFGP